MQYFIPLSSESDSQKSLGGVEEKFIISINFEYGDSGKAYEFDEHLPKYIKMINELVVEPVCGSFILQGEDSNDVKMYTVNSDGSVSVSEGVILFPNINYVIH